MKNFDPERAVTSLRKFVSDLTAIGLALEKQRIELVVKEADLLDKENEVREQIFTGKIEVQASKVRDYIKWKTWKAEREVFKSREELKTLIEKKDILCEVNNAMKFAYKLATDEMKNLPYQ